MAETTAALHVSSTDLRAPWPSRTYYGLSAEAWMRIGIIATLFAALFWPNFRRLWLKTNPFTGEPNWQHSFFVPFIGLYYLYLNRDGLLKARVATAWAGLPIFLGGLLMFAYGIWPGQNDFVKDFGMVVTLFGVVLLLCGWEVMKIAWFPIAFLVCALPWPQLVYSWVAMPLQELAASAATNTLRATGVDAVRSGTKIHMAGEGGVTRTLNVAEACAGLKSLMTFISVAAAVAFLSFRPLWQKAVITLSAVPIAIFCNMARVAGQGMLDFYVSRNWSESFAHQFAGMVMMIPAFFLILLVAWIVDNLFVEEVDKRAILAASKQKSAAPDAGLVIEVPRGGKPAAGARTAPAPAPGPAPARPSPAAAATPAGAAGASDLAAATQRLMAGGGIRSRRPNTAAAAVPRRDGDNSSKQEGR